MGTIKNAQKQFASVHFSISPIFRCNTHPENTYPVESSIVSHLQHLH